MAFSFNGALESRFINELFFICDTDDSVLLKKNNYQPSRFVEVSALGGISDASLVLFKQAVLSKSLS